jgi:tetratricopeptide (TPR) repeat protein
MMPPARPPLRLATVQLDFVPWLRTNSGAWWPAEPLITPDGREPAPELTVRKLIARDSRSAYRAVEEIAAEAIADRLEEVLRFLAEWEVDLAVLPEYALPATCLPALVDYARGRAIVAGLEYVRNADAARALAELDPSVPPDKLIERNVSVLVVDGAVSLVTKERLAQPESATPGSGVHYQDVTLNGRQVRLCVAICMDFLHLPAQGQGQQVDVVCVPALTETVPPFLGDAPRIATILANVARHGGSRIGMPLPPGPLTNQLGSLPIGPGREGITVVDYDDHARKPSSLRRVENALVARAEVIEDDAAHAPAVRAVGELTDEAWHGLSLDERQDRVSDRLGGLPADGPLAQSLAAYLDSLAQGMEDSAAYVWATGHLIVRPGNGPAAVRQRQAQYVLDLLRTSAGAGLGRADDAYTAVVGLPPHLRVSTEPPSFAPVGFLDRVATLDRLRDALARRAGVVVCLYGAGGYGKTAVVARLKEGIQNAAGKLRPEFFGYLSANGYRPINSVTLLAELADASPNWHTRDRVAECVNDPSLAWPDKFEAVLSALGRTRVLIVIDHAEKLLTRGGRFRDASLEDTVRDLARAEGHRIKLLLVSAVQPRPTGLTVDVVPLATGLPDWKYTKKLLLDFARHGPPARRGLYRVDNEVFEQLHRITEGHTRDVELIFAALTIDPGRPLQSLLDSLAKPGILREHLLDHIMANLHAPEAAVVRALAVFGRPVEPAAVHDVLRGHVPNEDADNALGRLTEARLIRLDGARRYLPPDPDGVHIWRRFRPARPADPPALTRAVMLHRAADYFERSREAAYPVRTVDHLAPHFSEIDLRLQGGERDTALRLMRDLDEAYLSGWGHSDSLSAWRRGLDRKLAGPDRTHNLSALANALLQRGDIEDALAVVDKALALDADGDPVVEIELRLQQGGCLYRDGRIGQAETTYQRAEELARHLADRKHAARAWDGLGLCHAETGRLETARTYFRGALAALGPPTSSTKPRLRQLMAQLQLNLGVLAGLRGGEEVALAAIRHARRIARGHPLLEAKCLDAEAVVLLNSGRTDAAAIAVGLAEEASRVGASAGNPELSRKANGTLALALLRRGREGEAFAAAASAARYDRSRLVLGALALKGLTALRMSRVDEAVRAFREVDDRAGKLLDRDSGWYQIWDTRALVLCGLALCDMPDMLDRAVLAYEEARRIESAAGVINRALRLLDDLTAGRDGDLLGPARDAAGGPPPTP